MDIQPLSDWIVVKFFPLKKRSESIELVGHGESAVRLGEVLLIGPGRRLHKTEKRAPMDVGPGDRIAFFRWHQEHRPGKANAEILAKMSAELGEDLCLIRQSDVLFSYTGDVTVDV